MMISCIIITVLSLMTEKPDTAKIAGLTYGSLTAEDRTAIRESWDYKDVLATVLVLAMVLGMYIYFSYWLS